jgi:hypothetical protein
VIVKLTISDPEFDTVRKRFTVTVTATSLEYPGGVIESAVSDYLGAAQDIAIDRALIRLRDRAK